MKSSVPPSNPESIYAFNALDIHGKNFALKKYRGKVMLIVNTASACGFTPQLKGLQALHQELGESGLVVLGFPCNQFGAQDPGSDGEIEVFCQVNYGVSFPMMAKVDVSGDTASPLFRWLCQQAPGLLGSRSIKWNFTKFLVDAQGHAIRRYASTDEPSQIKKDILTLLG
jgi:glutathione peroxidase